MGRPKTSWLVAREALLLARGSTVREAAAACGVSTRTVDNLISEHGRMSHVAGYRPRPNVLTSVEREEIRLGIDQGESSSRIATRLGRHRSTVWNRLVRQYISKGPDLSVRSQHELNEIARSLNNRP